MKQVLIFSLILFIDELVMSQEMKIDSFHIENMNAEWILEFEKLNSKPDQIEEIKRKIFTDTIYKREKSYCLMGIQNQKTLQNTIGKTNCKCKIMFILGVNGDTYFLDSNEYTNTNNILELMHEKNIDEVTVYKKGDVALALYGTYGRCGAVILYSNNRRLYRRVKNLH